MPALELEDGSLLTEGLAIVQFLADQAPDSGLAPPAGAIERYRLQEWLSFVSSELHKMFGPWLFPPEYGDQAREVARDKIQERFAYVDRPLARSTFLLGEKFTVADAYCFTIVNWSRLMRIDLAPYPNLKAYMERIAPGRRSRRRCAPRAFSWRRADAVSRAGNSQAASRSHPAR